MISMKRVIASAMRHRTIAISLVLIGVVATAGLGFILVNDGVLGTIPMQDLDEDLVGETVSVKGRVVGIVGQGFFPLDGFILEDGMNTSIFIYYDGDLPNEDQYVVVVGDLESFGPIFLTSFIDWGYINAYSWRPVILFP